MINHIWAEVKGIWFGKQTHGLFFKFNFDEIVVHHRHL